MKEKKGFTLIELIAVIMILAVIGVISTPMILKKYKESRINAMIIQESKLVESSSIMVLDYCNKPIDEEHFNQCSSYYTVYNKNYSYVCMRDLKSLGYYSEKLEFSGKECFGVVINKLDNKTNALVDSYAYVKCGNKYISEKRDEVDEIFYDLCLKKYEEVEDEEPVVNEPVENPECTHDNAYEIADGEEGMCFCENCQEWVECLD